MDTAQQAIITAEGLQALLDTLQRRGYRVVGPTVRDQAIVYDDIASVADLPAGWTDEQDGGRYRLARRDDDALFGYAVGPHSWKKFLHPPVLRLWHASATKAGRSSSRSPTPKRSPLSACAPANSMRSPSRTVFSSEGHMSIRTTRRAAKALSSSRSIAACRRHLLLRLDEDGTEGRRRFRSRADRDCRCRAHLFVLRGRDGGRGRGAGRAAASRGDAGRGSKRRRRRRPHRRLMGREMRADDLHELLLRNLEHPRWDDVAERCLTCGNCTMVCPTCFCTSVEDSSDLAGAETSRSRRWDSCFTMDFSYIHGGSVRASARSRYRQWMTHKLATWFDQFGTSGCVGCGRCITWCPVGIDITEEVRAIRESEPH